MNLLKFMVVNNGSIVKILPSYFSLNPMYLGSQFLALHKPFLCISTQKNSWFWSAFHHWFSVLLEGFPSRPNLLMKNAKWGPLSQVLWLSEFWGIAGNCILALALRLTTKHQHQVELQPWWVKNTMNKAPASDLLFYAFTGARDWQLRSAETHPGMHLLIQTLLY